MHLEMASERSENDSKMGPKMSPKWLQNGSQNGLQKGSLFSAPKKSKNIDFSLIFKAKRGIPSQGRKALAGDAWTKF